RYRRMVMCHMLADTPAELHAMADRIGVARRWYQRHASTPHYDIAKTRRQLALAAGAVELSRREVVEVIRRIREAVAAGTTEGRAWIEDCRGAFPSTTGISEVI
ncbi:hypothetical protein B1B_12860, partial [mine drainage metagenome]